MIIRQFLTRHLENWFLVFTFNIKIYSFYFFIRILGVYHGFRLIFTFSEYFCLCLFGKISRFNFILFFSEFTVCINFFILKISKNAFSFLFLNHLCQINMIFLSTLGIRLRNARVFIINRLLWSWVFIKRKRILYILHWCLYSVVHLHVLLKQFVNLQIIFNLLVYYLHYCITIFERESIFLNLFHLFVWWDRYVINTTAYLI